MESGEKPSESVTVKLQLSSILLQMSQIHERE